MIIDEFVELKISNKTVKYFNNIGYVCKVNDIIKIKPNELSKGSEVRINVKCDNCSSVNNISYNNYINKQITKYGFYVCKDCSHIKREKTCLEKYGVEHFSKLDKFKSMVESTSQEKWGVYNYTQTKEYIKKTKKTCLEKYGIEHFMQNEFMQNKTKETLLQK